MARAANAVDFWRGFALITIFINHTPGHVFERFTHKNIGFSDSAELFVFLAGWGLFYAVSRRGTPQPTGYLMWLLSRRAVRIYAAHIVIISIAISMLAAASIYLDNPLVVTWHNAEAVFYDPIRANIGLVLLTHQLGYFDILPLYVVLTIFAPVIALLNRFAHHAVLPVSFSLYVFALTYEINLKTWPVAGEWFFNPLAWQFLFVLGFTLANNDGVGLIVRRNLPLIRCIAAVILLGALAMVWTGWLPDPTRAPDPRLFFINYKAYVTPIRLVHFLALVAVFSAVFPTIARWLPRLTEFLSLIGRHSLSVFCVGSILSLGAQIVRYAAGSSMSVDIAILLVGLGAMVATAWLAEWPSRTRSAP